MDRWQYANDEHPPYCSCAKCVEEKKRKAAAEQSRNTAFSGLLARIKRFIRRTIASI